MILTKSRVRIKSDNPKVLRFMGKMSGEVGGEVVEVVFPSATAADQEPRYWVRLNSNSDQYISCLEAELEVLG
jgi:hypothetical protein